MLKMYVQFCYKCVRNSINEEFVFYKVMIMRIDANTNSKFIDILHA